MYRRRFDAATRTVRPASDPFARYLERLLAELAPGASGSPGPSAICLGAFARGGRLGAQAPRVATALGGAIERGSGDRVDRWLCASALRKTVSAEPKWCARCCRLLQRLSKDENRGVAADALATLSYLRSCRAPRDRRRAR